MTTRVQTLESNERSYIKELSDFKTKFKELSSMCNTLNNKVKDHGTILEKHKTSIRKVEDEVF